MAVAEVWTAFKKHEYDKVKKQVEEFQSKLIEQQRVIDEEAIDLEEQGCLICSLEQELDEKNEKSEEFRVHRIDDGRKKYRDSKMATKDHVISKLKNAVELLKRATGKEEG